LLYFVRNDKVPYFIDIYKNKKQANVVIAQLIYKQNAENGPFPAM